MQGFSFKQEQLQKQVQILSQKQLESLSILSLSSQELYDRIEKVAQENPAFTFTRVQPSTRLSSSSTWSAQEKSENFQAALEAKADTRESLQHHLMTQLHSMDLTESENEYGEQLIYHLDSHGFLLFDPISLLNKKDKKQTPALANKMLNIVQSLEPTGTCTKNFQESLLVQAKLSTTKNALAVFILDGHFDFLNPPQAASIQKKIIQFLNAQKKLFDLKDSYSKLDTSIEAVEKALAFIKKLDPYPALNYSTENTHFVEPDIYIEKSEEKFIADDFQNGIVSTKNCTFIIKTSWENNFKVSVKNDLPDTKNISKENLKKINESVQKAKEFIDALAFRQSTIVAAMCHIVKKQSQFFENGPGNLNALSQKELSKKLGVHETTVSRMANSKYVQCDWGFFPVKHFFSNAVSDTSRDKILHEIKTIIEEHKADKKHLSDIKLCALLEERGIKIARRTVAKYRGLLNIESSFRR